MTLLCARELGENCAGGTSKPQLRSATVGHSVVPYKLLQKSTVTVQKTLSPDYAATSCTFVSQKRINSVSLGMRGTGAVTQVLKSNPGQT